MPPITLTTDFGTCDHYVGAMKGVILGVCPAATIVDITHDIAPQNVMHAALVLRRIVDCFPPGSVHVVVVDPGVGSPRRILAGGYGGQIFIAPDNGTMTLVHQDLAREALHVVENSEFFRQPVAHTFHGRDILAPVAAHVASGVPLNRLGPRTAGIEMLQFPTVEHARGEVRGCVLLVDHFGNLVTNIREESLGELMRRKRDVEVLVGDTPVGPLRTTYSEVGAGEPLALIGSGGLMEISVNCGRADERFGASPGTVVSVR